MDRYQLRLPADYGVTGLAQSLTDGLYAEFDKLGLSWRADNPMTLSEAVHAVLEHHLVAYDTCGSSCICDESVSPVSWNVNPDPRLMSSDPTQHDALMRIQFRFSADEFYRFTAFLARIAATQTDVEDERAQLAQERLEKVVFGLFSSFLFDAPMCHHRELCQDAQPLDLWGGKEPGIRAFS